MPRRRGLRPRPLAAVIRLNATLTFAAERRVVGQRGARHEAQGGRMRAGSFSAMAVGIATLFMVHSAAAGQAASATVERESLDGHVRAARRGVLLLASAGLSRLGMWLPARAVSRELVAAADSTFDRCVAQAAVAWQTGEVSEEMGIAEWAKLERLAKDIEFDEEVSEGEKAMCRQTYRRVTGHIVWQTLSGSHCGPYSVERLRLEKVRVLFAAYQAAVQQGVAADGAAPRR